MVLVAWQWNQRSVSWQGHPDCPTGGDFLCKIDDIPDGGGLEVCFGEGKENFKILLLRKGLEHWSYLNSCPHFSLPLNFHPQKFIFSDGQLVCAHHTAFFEVESGFCNSGPCSGANLTLLPSYREGDGIHFGDRP